MKGRSLRQLVCRLTGKGCGSVPPSGRELSKQMQERSREVDDHIAVLRFKRYRINETADTIDDLIDDVSGQWRKEAESHESLDR